MSGACKLKLIVGVMIVGTVLLTVIPAQAKTTGVGKSVAALASSTDLVRHQLRQLDRRVASAPRSSLTHRRVSQATWRVIQLNRSLESLNQVILTSDGSSSVWVKAAKLNHVVALHDTHVLRLRTVAHSAAANALTRSVAMRASSGLSTRLASYRDTAQSWARYWESRVGGNPNPTAPSAAPTTATTVVTPTVTPTTAAADPTPTPTSGSATTSTMGSLSLWGVSNKVYENVTFDGAGTGGADSSGVIFVGSNCSNLIFRNCIIKPNKDGVGNGVKIYSGTGTVHDITFQNCTFMTQPRMGFECIGRGGGYSNVNLIDCTFEVQGSEAISYDGDTSGCGNSVVSGCLVKGGGRTSQFPWRQGIEFNGVPNMTLKGTTLYSCGGDGLNFNGPSGNCGWTVKDNVIDFSQGTVASNSDSSPICAQHVTGGTFSNNRITNKVGWTVAYFSDCHDMDWTGTVWAGANKTPYQGSCSGMKF